MQYGEADVVQRLDESQSGELLTNLVGTLRLSTGLAACLSVGHGASLAYCVLANVVKHYWVGNCEGHRA